MNLREMLDVALERGSIKLFDPEGEGIVPTALPRIIALKEKETARRADILDLDPEVIKKHWDAAVDALDQALDLMAQRYGCYGERFIPLVDMVAPLAVIISSEKFKNTGRHLDMLDRWYWRSVFAQYYVSAPETKIQRTVRQWLNSDSGWLADAKHEPESVRDFNYRTSILEDVARVDSAIYRGVMSLLLSKSIHDFGPQRRTLGGAPWEEIEDHHIYPKRFLGPYGIRGDRVNTIANRTPILRSTNSAAGNDAPHVYLAKANVVGSSAVAPIIREHLADPGILQTAFTEEVYSRFIADRKKRIIEAIAAVVGAEPIPE
jgi:hypothetical protein